MKKLILLTYCFLMLAGCAAQTTSTKVPFSKIKPENSRVIQGNLDKVWHSAVSNLSKDFFVLDNIERSSKIITLSFSVSDPEPYMDCGTITVKTGGGMSGDGVFTYPSSRKFVTFTISDGTPHAKPAKRTVDLSGKINLVFTETSKNSTEVTVNIKYVSNAKIETVRAIQVGFSHIMQPHVETFTESFTTGQASQQCTSTNALEKQILNIIESGN